MNEHQTGTNQFLPTRLSANEPWPRAPWRRFTLGLSDVVLRGSCELADGARHAAEFVGAPWSGEERSFSDTFAAWHDTQDWPERPLRIGFVNPGEWASDLVNAPGVANVEWFAVPSNVAPGTRSCFLLDACVSRQGSGSFRIETLEHAGKDAGWFDWGTARPLSFASVFPTRLDPSLVTLEAGEPGDVPLVRLLAEAAAVLSRHPARLNLRDRMQGRRPVLPSPNLAKRVGRFVPWRDVVRELACHMMDELGRYRTGAVPTSAERAVARFVSAWAVTWTGEGDDETRRVATEAAVRVAGDEPETMFRCAAARFANVDDVGGLEMLVRAERMIRGRDLVVGDQGAFFSGELDAGIPGPRTTGRLCAGLCLVACTLPTEKLAYFREDLKDDLTHATALVGRDQDHRLLMEVLRTIEHTRSQGGVTREAA
ncbi:hypothetical protein PHYC_03233 [Phycisphaerales bacterium]|nr:hypothetical protein PHYC_03233 [Phycisphaerales bacterium]